MPGSTRAPSASRRANGRARRALAVGLALVGVLANLGSASAAPREALPKGGTPAQVKAAVAASVLIKKMSSAQAAGLAASARDNASAYYHIPASCNTATACVFGDTSSDETVVMYGDSHARMWLSAVIPAAIAAKVKLVVVGEDGCPIVDLTWTGLLAHCNADRPKYVAVINAIRPTSILLSNRTSFAGISSASWQQGMTSTIQSLAPSGAKVAIIGDLQVMRLNPPQCLAVYPNDVQRCTEANPDHQIPGQEKAERAAAKATKSLYVDPTPWLCTSEKCVPIIGKYFAYWDSYHVSVTYAAYLSKVMGAALKTIL